MLLLSRRTDADDVLAAQCSRLCLSPDDLASIATLGSAVDRALWLDSNATIIELLLSLPRTPQPPTGIEFGLSCKACDLYEAVELDLWGAVMSSDGMYLDAAVAHDDSTTGYNSDGEELAAGPQSSTHYFFRCVSRGSDGRWHSYGFAEVQERQRSDHLMREKYERECRLHGALGLIKPPQYSWRSAAGH